MGDVQYYSRREFIGDILSGNPAGRYRISRIPTNPNSTTFPFLSQLATSYEHYQFKNLTFYFRPTTNENTTVTNTSLGTITMYFCYDALEPLVQSRNEANNYQGSRTSRICDPLAINVRVPKNPMYIRSPGSTGIDQDIRESDFGYLAIATENILSPGIPADSPIGELWVTYTVAFWKPKIQDFIGAGNLTTIILGVLSLNNLSSLNGFGVAQGRRQFICDNWGAQTQYATVVRDDLWNIVVRRGQIFSIQVRLRCDASQTGVQINTIPGPPLTGTAVAQNYYPEFNVPVDGQNIIQNYTSQLVTTTATSTTFNQINIFKATKDGAFQFNTEVPSGILTGAGQVMVIITLLNRPDYNSMTPVAQRNSTWFTPN